MAFCALKGGGLWKERGKRRLSHELHLDLKMKLYFSSLSDESISFEIKNNIYVLNLVFDFYLFII